MSSQTVMGGSGTTTFPATYPPKVTAASVLGYVHETNGIGYSRDIGRSIKFRGNDYLVFGDTFCKNKDGEFVGIVDNTATMITDRENPLESTYPSILPDGKVVPLVHWNKEEQLLFDETGTRTCLWPFSGIVETAPGVGWMWFEKCQISKEKDVVTPPAIGLAKVTCDETGQLRTVREKGMLFDSNEPRIGSFSTIVEGDFVYLFGQHERPKQKAPDEHPDDTAEPKKELHVFLARVDKCRPFDRAAYEYWNGTEYTECLWDAVPVFRGLHQGAIIRSTLWGPSKPWVFVGNDGTGSSQILVGAAKHLEGPWETHKVCTAEGIDYKEDFKYCMYPHQWASNEEQGELIITVCEHWPGQSSLRQ